MNWLSNAIRRIGTPDSISWPVFWITLAAGVIGNLISNAEVPLGVRVTALVAGQLALWLPLVLVGLVLRRNPERSRPVLVLSAAVTGLMVRAVVIGLLFMFLVGEEEAKWVDRFVGALLNVGLAFVISAYIVSSMRERRRHVTDLRALQARLAALVAEQGEQFERRNEDAVTRVQSILLAELKALDPADPDRSLRVLQRTATDVVRPLSHELARSRPDDHPGLQPMVSPAVAWRDILDDAASGTPFRPVVTASLFGIELVAATVAYRPGALVFSGLGVAIIVLLAVANSLLRHFLPGRPRIIRMAVVIAAAMLVGVILAGLMRVGLRSAPMLDALTLGVFFFAVLFSLGVGVAASARRDRDRIVRELQESSHTLRRRLVRWNQVQWFQQKALSRALHGPVQTAVTAGALRLDAAIRAGDVDPALVEQLRSELLATLGGLGSQDASTINVDEALVRITSTWQGLCAVSTSVGHSVEGRLIENAALRSCTIDIVTETISNAVRHGGATHVDIDITVPDSPPRDLNLSFVSDSIRGNGPIGRGLGTRLLDECTIEWRLEETEHGMRLVALLPAEG